MLDLVLDAWAIMAWLKDQKPAADRVRLLFEAADRREQKLLINVINLGEIFCLSVRARNIIYGERVLKNLRPRVAIISVTNELVMQASNFKATHAISYADAFAAATAISRDSALVTGDPELRAMAEQEKRLKLEWIAD